MDKTIAYFSMEIGLCTEMPTYAGGLGVLAGDLIRAAADLRQPMVGMTLLYRKGYFYQKIDNNGQQIEEATQWPVDDFLQEQPQRVKVIIEGRDVSIRAWKYEITGNGILKFLFFFLIQICRKINMTIVH